MHAGLCSCLLVHHAERFKRPSADFDCSGQLGQAGGKPGPFSELLLPLPFQFVPLWLSKPIIISSSLEVTQDHYLPPTPDDPFGGEGK